MKTLILEHVAPYLPYGLKWTLQELMTFTMTGITKETLYTKEGSVLNWKKHPDLPQALFPLLHPWSDLTKEIEHNGERFVPILKFLNNGNLGYNYINTKNPYFIHACGDFPDKSHPIGRFNKTIFTDNILGKNDYKTINKLIEWHFDINDLIKAGLAIDINTI